MDKDRVISRILRVNHAGEHGAVAIYSTQIARAKRAYPDLVPWLEETLSHEQRHQARFREAMPSRASKPCRLMFVWAWGGALLGAITAAFGRTGVYVCTAAVERTVHKHMVEQVAFLEARDTELAGIVRDILAEEDTHLAYADAHHDQKALLASLLSVAVAAATEVLIFLSTRGDSLSLKRALSA